MAVEVETVTPTKVSLTIEVEPERIKAERERVFHEMAKEVQIKGFRKGKAPRKMVEKYINQQALRQEVLERLVPAVYEEALKQQNIRPMTSPQVSVIQYEDNQPLKFKATLERRPDITLPDYKNLEALIDRREIKEEEVERTLATLREQRASFEEMSNGVVEEGKGAVVDFQGVVEGKPFEGGSSQGLLLEIKRDWPVIPGFMDQLLGMRAGEDREIRVTMPENFEPEIAGKEATFKVHVSAVKEKKLPEVDDAFAQSIGDFKTVEDLKEAVRQNIRTFHENEERGEALRVALDQLGDQLDFPVPEVAIEERMKQFERDTLQLLQQQQMLFVDFLKQKYPEVFAIEGSGDEQKTSRAVERFREELRPRATKMAKIDLILDEVSEREKLQVTQEEVNSEIRRLSQTFQMSAESITKALQDRSTFQNFLQGILRAKAALVIRNHLKISYQNGEKKA